MSPLSPSSFRRSGMHLRLLPACRKRGQREAEKMRLGVGMGPGGHLEAHWLDLGPRTWQSEEP